MPNEQSMSQELLGSLNKRKYLKSRFTKFVAFLKDKDICTNLNELELRYEKLVSFGEEFESIQVEIETLDDDNLDQRLNEREEFEKKYFKACSECKQFMKSASASTISSAFEQGIAPTSITVSNNTSQSQLKLPVIKLPLFGGSYTEWATFYDSYHSLVENNENLSNVEKFHYLKSCLLGEAKQVVDGLIVTADNYETAWNLLKDRYENKRLISQHHMKFMKFITI